MLRSPRSDSHARNVDVVFVGVVYVDLPTRLRGLRIREGDATDTERVGNRVTSGVRVFAVDSDGGRYLISASAVKVTENDLGVFETTLDF